jgi:transposase
MILLVYRDWETYRLHGLDYYLDTHYCACESRLSQAQHEVLYQHVSTHFYNSARAVGAWIKVTFGVSYHCKHMVKLLHELGFVYKKTRLVPGESDLSVQETYLEGFNEMMANKSADTLVFFNDGVHPQFNTHPEYGWILKGDSYEIPSQAGRLRLNITESLNTNCPTQIYVVAADSVHADSVKNLWEQIELKHPKESKVHICDDARYDHSF